MATTAARDLIRVLDLSEEVAGLSILAVCQALDLRGMQSGGPIAAFRESIREIVPMLIEDRRMDHDQAAVVKRLRSDGLPLSDAFEDGLA